MNGDLGVGRCIPAPWPWASPAHSQMGVLNLKAWGPGFLHSLVIFKGSLVNHLLQGTTHLEGLSFKDAKGRLPWWSSG